MSTIASASIQELQIRISRFDDQVAYKELYISFYPSLFQFVLGIIKSRQSAEEVVSDLFIRIWEKRKNLEEIRNLRVYCFVAARHMSINQLEKLKSQRVSDIEYYKNQLVYNMPDPEQTMISSEMIRRIHLAVEELPARCKMTFKLVKDHGFKYREAAEILQVSEKTIENQMSIAIKKISASINFDISRCIPLTA